MNSIQPETTHLRRKGRGYCADGPGFYVWDEDPREVMRVASELRRGRLNPRPTARMLIIPPPADPEPDPTATLHDPAC